MALHGPTQETQQFIDSLASMGRSHGKDSKDTELAHVSLGDAVIPNDAFDAPARKAFTDIMERAGRPAGEHIVGDPQMRFHPETGMPEFDGNGGGGGGSGGGGGGSGGPSDPSEPAGTGTAATGGPSNPGAEGRGGDDSSDGGGGRGGDDDSGRSGLGSGVGTGAGPNAGLAGGGTQSAESASEGEAGPGEGAPSASDSGGSRPTIGFQDRVPGLIDNSTVNQPESPFGPGRHSTKSLTEGLDSVNSTLTGPTNTNTNTGEDADAVLNAFLGILSPLGLSTGVRGLQGLGFPGDVSGPSPDSVGGGGGGFSTAFDRLDDRLRPTVATSNAGIPPTNPVIGPDSLGDPDPLDPFGDDIATAFPGKAFSLDDGIIQSIIDERLGGAQTATSSEFSRGNLNTTGLTNANEFLSNQQGDAFSRLTDIGNAIQGGNQNQVNAIRDRATESSLVDELFNIQPFADERTQLINDLNLSFEQDLLSSLGSEPLFDLGGALSVGGNTQGLVSGTPNVTFLDVLANRESGITNSPTTGGRGTKTTGSGAF